MGAPVVARHEAITIRGRPGRGLGGDEAAAPTLLLDDKALAHYVTHSAVDPYTLRPRRHDLDRPFWPGLLRTPGKPTKGGRSGDRNSVCQNLLAVHFRPPEDAPRVTHR